MCLHHLALLRTRFVLDPMLHAERPRVRSGHSRLQSVQGSLTQWVLSMAVFLSMVEPLCVLVGKWMGPSCEPPESGGLNRHQGGAGKSLGGEPARVQKVTQSRALLFGGRLCRTLVPWLGVEPLALQREHGVHGSSRERKPLSSGS